MKDQLWTWIVVGAAVVVGAGTAMADADQCEAAKLKTAGKYSFCRMKAEAKAVKTGGPADYSKCDSKLALKWTSAETIGGGMCPTSGDQTAVKSQLDADANFVALKLAGARFVDNGDGTVTDVETGLMWEKKDDLGGIHDKDNLYTWSTTGSVLPDGSAFGTFLGTLNNDISEDGTTSSGCFAGHCDWRLPTSVELRGILAGVPPCSDPCIDPTFGPAESDYWTITSDSAGSDGAWIVYFDDGGAAIDFKEFNSYVRAVRTAH